MRKFFGWLYAFVSVCVLFAFVVSLRRAFITEHTRLHLGTVGALSLQLLFAFIFSMAWWTSWKERPGLRVWGIAASVTNLSVPLFLMSRAHLSLSRTSWEVIVLSGFSFIAYVWPEKEERLDVESLHDNPHSPAD